MKKLISMFLAVVAIMSVMTVPAFAAEARRVNECVYGIEYEEVPMVRKTDEYGKTIYVKGNTLNNKVFDLSDAPEMKYTKTIGDVTFSNYIKHNEKTLRDSERNKVDVIQIYVGIGASMRSNVDGLEFMRSGSNGFNSIPGPLTAGATGEAWPMTSDMVQIKTNTPIFFGYTGTPLYRYIDYVYIRPYTNGGRNEDGTWQKGLTWVFEENPDGWGYAGNENDYMDIHCISVENKGAITYYQVIVTDDTNFVDDPNETPVETNPVDISTVTVPKVAEARPTTSPIYINGVLTEFEAYNINGNNYFKLRDVALKLRGTEKQFEVVWNPSYTETIDGQSIRSAVDMTSNKAYTTIGGEMKLGDGLAKTANLTTSPILKDGAKVTNLTGYNINGNNFFKLRDLGILFDFDVTWDTTRKAVVVDTSKSYTED